jgi:hypothetical protein
MQKVGRSGCLHRTTLYVLVMRGAYHWRFAVSDTTETCRWNSGHVLVSAVGRRLEPGRTRTDTKPDIIPDIIHIKSLKGHQMGHHLHKALKGTPFSCPLVSHQGPARIQISRGLRAMASRGEVANQSGEGCRNASPKQSCGFGRLWYSLPDEFTVPQGWRHGVRSRSLG